MAKRKAQNELQDFNETQTNSEESAMNETNQVNEQNEMIEEVTVEDTDDVEIENTIEDTEDEDETNMLENESTISETDWNELIERIDVLNVNNVQGVISYCKERLKILQQEEIAKLEEEMRLIHQKLVAMKNEPVLFPSTKAKKKEGRIIVNPANPNDVYSGFGKRPDWLKALLEPAAGDKMKEQEILETLRK